MNTIDLKNIQKLLRELNISGWLLSDFRVRDPFSYAVLGLDSSLGNTRRWFYFIPARGLPIKIVSAVEQHRLDQLPGKRLVYREWKELHTALKIGLGKATTIAMQYSAKNGIPYLSTVDAGTVELVRSFGHRVVTSAALLSRSVGRISPEGYRSHLTASKRVDKIRAAAFELIGHELRRHAKISEFDVQQFILEKFAEAGLQSEHAPIVGANANPANPHFEPTHKGSHRFKSGDTVLIDLWARLLGDKSIYFDSTWVGYIGKKPAALYLKIFALTRAARDSAINYVEQCFEKGRPCLGCDVDDVARKLIAKGGFEKYFVHRTGHSITTSTHGEGVNIDNFETHDDREVLPGACFSIEPGIYLPGKMAVRLETNMFIRADGTPSVTGELQNDLVRIEI